MSSLIAVPLLGVCTGCRAMTPIALVCWYAHLRYLPVENTWAFWTANVVSVVIFTLLAAGEYIGDKLPGTPARIAAFPLMARLGFGGLVGAVVSTALGASVLEGIFLGVAGALIGAYGGYHIRRHLVHKVGWPDLRVALVEDGLALLGSFVALGVVTR